MQYNSRTTGKKLTQPEHNTEAIQPFSNGDTHHQSSTSKPISNLTIVLIAAVVSLLGIIAAINITFFVTRAIYLQQFASSNPNNNANATTSSPLSTSFGDADGGDGNLLTIMRLPRALKPIFYNLTLKIYVPGFIALPPDKSKQFDAAWIGKFTCLNATDKIVLSAKNLRLPNDTDSYVILQDSGEGNETTSNSGASFSSTSATAATFSASVDFPSPSSGKTPPGIADQNLTNVVVNDTSEMLILQLDRNLVVGQNYFIKILYSGTIVENLLSGLYLSQYQSANGTLRHAAGTQSHPTYARRIAPCLDEPEYKAVWKLQIIHPVGTTAIANGIEIVDAAKTLDPLWLHSSFQETLPMSSYLLAFAVTEFTYKEGFTNTGVRFRIWARREAAEQTTYALQIGIKSLEYYEAYYGIPFPMPKQDMLALPDFSAGAMENWGLIVYRERVLLFDPKIYTPTEKRMVAMTVTHELAHQWFGNLVTMRWWSDVWLNEGFASYMSYLAVDAVTNGSFHMKNDFLYDSAEVAYRTDARANSHPMNFPILKTEDIEGAFDAISYDKGGTVIRMIEFTIGTETFKRGLNLYLNRYKYKNAMHGDLWRAFQETLPANVSNGESLNITAFAARWTDQSGYPSITVNRIDEAKVQLLQGRFKVDANAGDSDKYATSKYNYTWDIPVWYQFGSTKAPMTWLYAEDGPGTLNSNANDVLVLNIDSLGFYRVGYDDAVWNRTLQQLSANHTVFSEQTRAVLIRDAFALAEASEISYPKALNLTTYLSRENAALPWQFALDAFLYLSSFFGDEPESKYLKDYLRVLLQPMYAQVDWNFLNTAYMDDQNFEKSELQVNVITQFCKVVADGSCLNNLNVMFHNGLLASCSANNSISSVCSTVPLPMRQLVYCEGVGQSGNREFDTVFALYQRETVQVERDKLLVAVACSRDSYMLKRLLAMSLDANNTVIRRQDAGALWSYIGSRPVGLKLMFDYFLDNWSRIYAMFNEDLATLSGIIVSSINLKRERDIRELENFMGENEATVQRVDFFTQQLEVSRSNVAWLTRNLQPLTAWFRNQLR